MVNDLVAKDSKASAAAAAEQSNATPSGYENLVVTVEKGVCKIMMNRPKKKNAINREVCSPLY